MTTRHAEDAEGHGLHFSARLDKDALDIKHILCPVGTKITIQIPKESREDVSKIVGHGVESILRDVKKLEDLEDLAYYALAEPSFLCIIDPIGLELSIKAPLPSVKDEFSYPWRFAKHSKYQGVHWTYKRHQGVSCNGILIEKYNRFSRKFLDYSHPMFELPYVSIFDPDGALPVNLQRQRIIGKIDSFRDELVKSVANDLIAYALVTGPKEVNVDSDVRWVHGEYPGFGSSFGVRRAFGDPSLWAVTSTGFMLNHARVYDAVGAQSIIMAFVGDYYNPLLNPEIINSINDDQILSSVGRFSRNLSQSKACLSSVLAEAATAPFDSNVNTFGHRA